MDVRSRTDKNPTPPTEGGMGHSREDFSEMRERGVAPPPAPPVLVVLCSVLPPLLASSDVE